MISQLLTGLRVRGVALPVLGVVVLLFTSTSVKAQVSIEVFARTNTQSGAADGTLTSIDDAPQGGAPGAPIFVASYKAGTSSLSGLYSGNNRVARNALSGESALGTNAIFGGFRDVIGASNGAVAFSSTTDPGSIFGFWTNAGGSFQPIAQDGGAAPGTNLTFLMRSDLGGIGAFNSAGQVAFNAYLNGAAPGTGEGLWMGRPGELVLVARPGEQAPGFPAGTLHSSTGRRVRLNSAGQLAFWGGAVVPGLGGPAVLWAGTPGALQVVVKSDDPAPDTIDGAVLYLNEGEIGLNNAGELAFISTLNTIVGGTTAMYVGAPGALRIAARTGTQAPGTVPGTTFTSLDAPTLNKAGELFFRGTTASPEVSSNEGLWTGRIGRLRLIAQKGEVAPNTGGAHYTGFAPLMLSDSGQVVFRASLDSSSATGTALFATDKRGAVRLVARFGDSLAGSPPIIGFDFQPLNPPPRAHGQGLPVSVNAAGEIVFSARWLNNGNGFNGPQALFIARFPESAPVILPNGQPESVAAVLGGSATFQVDALGSRPASFQWRRNGVNIPGAKGASLTLTNLSEAARGSYTVVVTNAFGSAVSTPANLAFLPVITVHPRNQVVSAGTTAVLEVLATGPGALTYQWQYKPTGGNQFTQIAGATQSILSLPNVAAKQAGRYRVRVSNADGFVISREAVLTVVPAGQLWFERVLAVGDPLPALGPNIHLRDVESVVLNNQGEIAFEARLQDSQGNAINPLRVVAGPPDDLRTFQHHGFFFHPNLSDSGETVMTAQSLSSNSIIDEGVLFGFPDSPQLLSREGAPAPGTNTTFSLNFNYLINRSGTPAFADNTNAGFATFIGRPGAVQLVSMANQQAPGLPKGVVFNFPGEPTAFNDAGAIVTVASVKGPGITENNDEGIWIGGAGTLHRILAEGDPAPNAGAGVVFGNFFDSQAWKLLGLNNAGQIVFANRLVGAGTQGLDEALYAGAPGSLQLVVRNGMSASGHTFIRVLDRGYPPLINAAGQVVFVATVQPTGQGTFLQGLWRWTPGANGGTLQLIARAGQQVPGLPAGVTYGSADYGAPIFSPAMNAAGQIAFNCFITGPEIDEAHHNHLALFLTTPTGEVKLAARYGDFVDVGGGVRKKLDSFSTSGLRTGGEDGLPRALNDSGELVFAGRLEGSQFDHDLFKVRLPTANASSRLLNIATRMKVETGDNVLIAGFIITGNQPKKVLIRGIGPSLPFGGVLADPTLSLDNGAVTNDNWQTNQEQEIVATTIPPSKNLESAIVATLPAGGHTAILRGNGGATGIGVVEVYDLESDTPVRLANISSRGLVQSGDNVMIGGFIIGNGAPARILLRAIGPSLPFSGKLQDPTLQLVDANGASIFNNNWRTGGQEAEIIATTIPPSNDQESAILAVLPPGNHTAIVRGKDDTTGIAVVEAYNIQ